MGFPFRFYGANPGDWYEGANDGHLFEVAFVTSPSDAERAELARDFERFFAVGPARAAATPWLWSRHVARFAIGERWSSSARACFARVADFLRQVHGRTPLSDVVFWGAREVPSSGWDHWSRAAQALPDPGPSYSSSSGFRSKDPTLPEAVADPAFEEARARTRRLLATRRLDRAMEGSGISVVPIDGVQAPPLIPDWARKQVDEPEPKYIDDRSTRADGLHVVAYAPRVAAARYVDNRVVGHAFVQDDGTVREVRYPEGVSLGSSIWVHPDGTRALSSSIRDLYEIDFETGIATRRFVADTGVTTAAFVDQGRRWLVRSYTQISVLDPSTQTPTQVSVVRRSGRGFCPFHVVRDGTIVATNDGEKNRLYGYCEGKLKKLVDLPMRLTQLFEDDYGDLITRSWVDGVWACHRIDGLDTAYEAWAGPRRAKAEKRRAKAAAAAARARVAPPAKAKKATKLSVEPATGEFTAPSPYQRADASAKEAFPEGSILVAASSAVFGTLANAERHDAIVFRPDGGSIQRVEPAELAELGANPWRLSRRTITPCGTIGVASHDTDPWGVLIAELETSDVQLCEREMSYGDLIASHRLGPDTLVLQFEPAGYQKNTKGRRIEVLNRKRKRWSRTTSIQVTKSAATASHGPFLAVRTTAANSLVVFGADETGALLKLGQFKLRAHQVAFDAAGRLLFVNPEGDLHQVVGLKDVLARKAALAAKKR